VFFRVSDPLLKEISLENEFVRLEPLRLDHLDGLWEASTEEIWDYMPLRVARRSEMKQYIQEANETFACGQGLGFAVRDPLTEEVVGSTGFWNFVPKNKRIEIGFTWYAPDRQRTAVNTSCKLLLLTHAFDTLNLNRVEFKTDSLNHRSRAAIARIGGTEEGTLRAHSIQPDGRLRDSVYFSILKSEWPGVRNRLVSRLAKG
jgi:RimJ/RimL family protein N-acetyltransferase